MLIYDALKKDHDLVKSLLHQLVSLSDDSGQEKKRLIAQIRDALVPHSRAEEAVFYNSIRLVDTGKKLAMHGYKEHMEAETLLRSLQVEDTLHTDWRNTAIKLQEALEHHIAEEETEIFDVAKANFTNEEAQMIGEAFEKLKPEIKEEGFMGTTLKMVKNLLPPRLSAAADSPVQEVIKNIDSQNTARH